MTAKLPSTASVATATQGGKLHAPSASRNAAALSQLLAQIAPGTGNALEIASGTGQHITRFAAALPHLNWTPSEVAPDRIASISAYRAEAGLTNLAAPIALNACTPGWSAHMPARDLIVTINLLHLISAKAAQTLIHEAAHALAPKGTLALYGPFLRAGKTTSDGDARFHADLQSADPAIGYKDRDTVIEWGRHVGLSHSDTIAMPANNLALIFTSP